MEIDGVDVPVAVSPLGDAIGPPAIIVPGGPCRGPEYLAEFAGLGRSHPLLVMHPRGTPASGCLSRGWWRDAEDLHAVAHALDVVGADVIAHSAGTRLALAAAARFPGLVRSLVLVTPSAVWLTGSPYDGEPIAAGRREPEVAEALRSLKQDPEPTTDAEFRALAARQAPAGYRRWTETEQAHARLGGTSLDAVRAWFYDIPPDAGARILGADLPPVLVVGGDQDLLSGVQPVRDYARALGGELAVIADCGHYPWIEQPEAFHEVVSAWLTRG